MFPGIVPGYSNITWHDASLVIHVLDKQFQEIRLYYEFADVDVDRYKTARGYRQVMVSAREMELANLPGTESQWRQSATCA